MTYSRRIRLSPMWVAIALALAIVLLAFAAVPAFADVHGVSQAGCGAAASGGNAGATQSRDKGGRPAGQIPQTASGGASGSGGGDGDGACDVK